MLSSNLDLCDTQAQEGHHKEEAREATKVVVVVTDQDSKVTGCAQAQAHRDPAAEKFIDGNKRPRGDEGR